MSKLPKYYLAQVEEANGEYEYCTSVLIVAKSQAGAEKTLTKLCRTWYNFGSKMYVENDKCHFNYGGVCTWEGSCVEISQSTFLECKKILHHWGLAP